MGRVAVTGVGIVSPLGLDAPTTWNAAVAGQSGIDWIEAFDATGLPVRIAAEIKGFDPLTVVSPKDARKLERFVLTSVAVAKEALTDSGLTDYDPTRVGVIFGSAIGGVTRIAEEVATLRDRGPDRVSPGFLPSVLVDTASGQIAISLGIKGLNYAIVSACATGSHAIGEAAEVIKRGDCDAVIAGGTEACVDPADPRRLHRHARARRRGRVPAARLAAVRRDARGLRDRRGRRRGARRGLGSRRRARRGHLRRGARLRRVERRASASPSPSRRPRASRR